MEILAGSSERDKRTYYQNPELTQASYEIQRRHDQFLTLQNDKRLGRLTNSRQECQATAFTQRAQDLKNEVLNFVANKETPNNNLLSTNPWD